MTLLLHRYEEQIANLLVLVETHHAGGMEIATQAVDIQRMLTSCRARLDLARAASISIDGDIERLDAALRSLENGSQSPTLAAMQLDGWGGWGVPEYLLADGSLGGRGPRDISEDLLTELLSADDLGRVRAHLARPTFQRLKWMPGDYLICAATTLLGLSLELLNVSWRASSPIDVDGKLRGWFNDRFHDHPGGNPIDYQGPGFGGEFHRARSRGHDLFRFLDAVDQTVHGEFRGVRWRDGTPFQVVSRVTQYGRAYPEMDWTAAFVNVTIHLFADFFSAHSLPLPLTSVVFENAGRELRTFVHSLYNGGFHLRHVALNAVEFYLAALGIEIWLWLQHGSSRDTDPVRLKRYEMRAAVFGMLSGANIAGCAVFRNPFLLNLPVLIGALDAAVQLVTLHSKKDAWIYKECRNLDDLLTQWDAMAGTVS